MVSHDGRISHRSMSWALAGLLLAAPFSLVGCSSGDPDADDEPTVDAEGEDDANALDDMAATFDGAPSRTEIQALLDEVMVLYDTPRTEENYSRAGSTLVALSADLGVSEMNILEQMRTLYTPDAALTFPEAAALAATELSITTPTG